MMDMEMAAILLIPFLGTVLVLFYGIFHKKELSMKLEKILLGFAAGVMIAASVWSLLIPSIEMAEDKGGIPWVPAAVGFISGIGFLLILDSLIPHLHRHSDKPEGVKKRFVKDYDACAGGDAAQSAGGYGGRCKLCRIAVFRNEYDIYRSFVSCNRNSDTEFPRREL